MLFEFNKRLNYVVDGKIKKSWGNITKTYLKFQAFKQKQKEELEKFILEEL